MQSHGREEDMFKGKLNKREMATILRAQDILNDWIDYQEDQGITSDNDTMTCSACNAVVGLVDFIGEYDEGGQR